MQAEKRHAKTDNPTDLKWRSATRDFIFMFWIIANDCACLMIYLYRDCLVNKLNYGILHQLPATSGYIKSKQQTFTLRILSIWSKIWNRKTFVYSCIQTKLPPKMKILVPKLLPSIVAIKENKCSIFRIFEESIFFLRPFHY